MSYKEKSKKRIDAHVARTVGVTRSAGREKGRRAAAWAEVKALETLLQAAREA